MTALWIAAGFSVFCGIGNAVIQVGITERINKL